MSIPTISACDLLTQKKRHSHVVVHPLKALLNQELFIPNRPHRHTFYQVMYIEKGKGVHKIDFQDYAIEDQTLFFLAPGQVHTISFSDESEVKGVIVNFNDNFFHTFLAKPDVIDNFPFFNRNGKNSLFKPDSESKRIKDLFIRMMAENDPKYIRLRLLELLYLIDDIYATKMDNSSFASTHRLVDTFFKLLEKNYDAEHYPKFYAQELAVTPNHLNAMIQNAVGKSAGTLIRERILLESKRLLVNSQLNISEIAYLLGFDDTSYFIKFFKKVTGMTPNAFRKGL